MTPSYQRSRTLHTGIARGLRPALQGIAKVDANDRFCAHLLLSITDGDHIPFYLATFVHDLCWMVTRRRTDLSVELDGIGFTFEAGLICS